MTTAEIAAARLYSQRREQKPVTRIQIDTPFGPETIEDAPFEEAESELNRGPIPITDQCLESHWKVFVAYLVKQGLKIGDEPKYRKIARYYAQMKASQRVYPHMNGRLAQPPKRGLRIHGSVGCGKTTLIEALNRKVFFPKETEFSRYYSDNALFTILSVHDIRLGYMTEEMAYMKRLCDQYWHETIVIDDLGAEKDSQRFGNDFGMDDILTWRYECFRRYNVHTIVTTNLKSEEIKKRYGERVESRLYEMCEPVILKGDDWRKKRKESE